MAERKLQGELISPHSIPLWTADVSVAAAGEIEAKIERILGAYLKAPLQMLLYGRLARLGEGSTTCWKLGGEHCKNKVCFMRGRREVDTSYWVYNMVLGM